MIEINHVDKWYGTAFQALKDCTTKVDKGATIGLMNLTFPLFRIFGIDVRIHWFYPIFLAIPLLQAGGESGWSGLLIGFHAALMAGLLITSLPVIGAYLIFQRHLVRGIVAGAVK